MNMLNSRLATVCHGELRALSGRGNPEICNAVFWIASARSLPALVAGRALQ